MARELTPEPAEEPTYIPTPKATLEPQERTPSQAPSPQRDPDDTAELQCEAPVLEAGAYLALYVGGMVDPVELEGGSERPRCARAHYD